MNKKALAIGAVVFGGAYFLLRKEAGASNKSGAGEIQAPPRGMTETFDDEIAGTGTISTESDGTIVTRTEGGTILEEPGAIEMEVEGEPLTQEELARRLQDAAEYNPELVF